MNKPCNRFAKHLLAIAISTVPLSSFAQIEEIIVTAQQREQSLQDVPISVSAMDGETMDNLNMDDVTDIFLFVPGVSSTPNYPFTEKTSVRGVGSPQFSSGFDPQIGVFVNGVYQGRNGAQAISLYDVAQVEVIKGPLGTLFGRSTIAGAYSIQTEKPNHELGGYIDLGVGSRNRVQATGVLNVPINDRFAIRAGFHTQDEDGFLHNLADGQDVGENDIKAGRLTALYHGDDWEGMLYLNYEDRKEAPNIYQLTGPQSELAAAASGFSAPLGEFDIISDLSDRELKSNSRLQEISGTLKFELSDQTTLTSITSYREAKYDYAEDFDGTDLTIVASPYTQTQDVELFQQEIRVNYESESGLSVVLGGSYYREELTGSLGYFLDLSQPFADTVYYDMPTREVGFFEGEYSGWSVFADITYELTERINLTGGARYSFDDKKFSQYVPDPGLLNPPGDWSTGCSCFVYGYHTSSPIVGDKDWDDVSLRIAIDYEVADSVTTYFAWAQGWKSGAFDSVSIEGVAEEVLQANIYQGTLDASAEGATPASGDPETNDSFEIGLKSYWFDQTLQANIAAYFYRFNDLQVLVSRGAAFVLDTVEELEGRGLEADFRFVPDDHWDIFLNFSYIDSEIKKFSSSPGQVGEPNQFTPEWTFSTVVNYAHPVPGWNGELFTTVSYAYTDEFLTNNDSSGGPRMGGDYELTNLRIGYRSDDNWRISAFVDNLFDEYAYSQSFTPETGFIPANIIGNIIPGRTLGIDLHYEF